MTSHQGDVTWNRLRASMFDYLTQKRRMFEISPPATNTRGVRWDALHFRVDFSLPLYDRDPGRLSEAPLLSHLHCSPLFYFCLPTATLLLLVLPLINWPSMKGPKKTSNPTNVARLNHFDMAVIIGPSHTHTIFLAISVWVWFTEQFSGINISL